MYQITPKEIITILDLRSLRKATGSLQSGIDQSPSSDELKNALNSLPVNPNQEEIKNWLSSLESNVQDSIIKQLIIEKKKDILDLKIGNKRQYMSHNPINSLNEYANSFHLSELEYFESFFTFADRTSNVYTLEDVGGVFSQIQQEAETKEDASELFKKFIKTKGEIDNVYAEAIGRVPSGIIGDISFKPTPRLIRFLDAQHIYFEYWSTGEEITEFDVNKGDYRTIRTRARTAVRVHLDSNTIEYTSDKDSEDHESLVLSNTVDQFGRGEPGIAADGGIMRNATTSRVRISTSDIAEINKKVGVMSTLDSFRGQYANTEFHSVNDRPVDQDQYHEQLRNRGYIKSHPKLLIGARGNQYELLDPKEVRDDYAVNNELPPIKELVSGLEQNSTYDEVEKFTIVLNSDENTIRIWKSALPPEVRRTVFHLVVDELGW